MTEQENARVTHVEHLRALGMLSLFGGSAITGIVAIAYLQSPAFLWAGIGLSVSGFLATAVVAGRIKDEKGHS